MYTITKGRKIRKEAEIKTAFKDLDTEIQEALSL